MKMNEYTVTYRLDGEVQQQSFVATCVWDLQALLSERAEIICITSWLGATL